MSSRTHTAPTPAVDADFNKQELPPPVQSPRARSIKPEAQMPGYLPDKEILHDAVMRQANPYSDILSDAPEGEAPRTFTRSPPVSSRVDCSSSGNNEASSGHDQASAKVDSSTQTRPATSVTEDPDEDEDESFRSFPPDPYEGLKADWEYARNSQDEVKFMPKRLNKTTSPWQSCLNHLVKRDKTSCEAWGDDMNSILIFAGLFSAVVTAFTIESYQWLEADPADTTNAILLHISEQLAGSQRAAYTPTEFTLTSSVRRINVYWFLSLMFALTTAVLAILCKQWIREHHRELPAHSYQEEISLRQMRFESLRYWKVGGIIATLPLLLQIALVVVITTVLPVAVFMYHTNGNPEGYNVERADVLPCAFKSTQSWLFLKAVLVFQRFIRNISVKYDSWTSTDHPIIERPANPQLRESSFARYLCSGLGWIDEHVSNKDIVPDLYLCIYDMEKNDLDAFRFAGGDPPVLSWPINLPDNEEALLRLEKHNMLLRLFLRRLPHDREGQLKEPLAQLILRSIADIKYYTESVTDGKKKPVPPEAWYSWDIFMMMDLRETRDWSPPFLCALIAHAIRLSFSFEDTDKGIAQYTYNRETFWICWLIRDVLQESRKLEHNGAVVRYLMEEGVLRTLSLATAGDDEENLRQAFINRCEEPKNQDTSYGSIRAVVHLLEKRRLELEIKASELWEKLVDDLNLVY